MLLVFATFGALFAGAYSLQGCSIFHNTTASIKKTLQITDEPLFAAPTVKIASMPEPFHVALQELEEEKFEAALTRIDTYLRNEPTQSYTQAMVLASGRALEGLGRWTEAASRYRNVITATETVAPKLQATALYRLSFCHEALGDDQQTVAALHDLLSRAKYLSREVGQAEVPARLAAAFARVGNFEKAVEYYRQAESGIMKLKQENAGGSVPQWLPRTLYYMGSMVLRRVTWDDFETAIRPLARAQTYLLQSAELDVEPWSERSAQDLLRTYQELWNTIERAPVARSADPVVEQRAIETKQIDRSALVLETLQELRARVAPDQEAKRAKAAQKILAFLKDLEKQIQARLNQRPAGEGLTAAAQMRKSGLHGRVISPDTILEQKFLESAREAEQLPQKPLKKKSGENGDPNL